MRTYLTCMGVVSAVVVALISILASSLFSEINRVADVHRSRHVLSKDLCNEVVALAEQGTWQRDRHRSYPTTDQALLSITGGKALWETKLKPRIMPLLAQLHRKNEDHLSLRDVFVVLYDGDTPKAQRGLQLHQDGSHLSFNLALSEPTAFDGGGTYIWLRDEGDGCNSSVVDLDQGGMLSHPSGIHHSGADIYKGRRYILVGFVYVQDSWAEWFTNWYGAMATCVRLHDGDTEELTCRSRWDHLSLNLELTAGLISEDPLLIFLVAVLIVALMLLVFVLIMEMRERLY